MAASELPPAREEFGFRRTACDCEFCTVYCRHVPGSLATTDLPRLCPPGQDVFAWAEQHLRAVTSKPYPTLVPARQANGHCHWHFDGLCAVHEQAPYSCAFFDSHMGEEEAERRSHASIRARQDDAAAHGLYFQVWQHLIRKGLTSPGGDWPALREEMARLRRQRERNRRRAGGG